MRIHARVLRAAVLAGVAMSCADAPQPRPDPGPLRVLVQQDPEAVINHLSRQIRESLVASNVRRVAIPNLITHADIETELGAYLADKLTNSLFANASGFEVVDRIHLNSIVREVQVGAGIGDLETIQALGKVLGADALVVGTITDMGEEYDITLRMIETERAKVLAIASEKMRRTGALASLFGKEIAALPTRAARGGAGTVEGSGQAESAVESPRPLILDTDELKIEFLGAERAGGLLRVRVGITNASSVGLAVTAYDAKVKYADGMDWAWRSDTNIRVDKECGDEFYLRPGETGEAAFGFRKHRWSEYRFAFKSTFKIRAGPGECREVGTVVVPLRSDEVTNAQ